MACLRVAGLVRRICQPGVTQLPRRLQTSLAANIEEEELRKSFSTPEGRPRLRGRPFMPGSGGVAMSAFLKPASADFPIFVTPSDLSRDPSTPLSQLGSEVRKEVEELLLKHGAIVLRGFGLDSKEDFDAFCHGFGYKRMAYVGGSGNREILGRCIMPSSSDPGPFTIDPHSEMSYWTNWPDVFFLYCETPPEPLHGGENVLGSNRDITAAIDPEIRELFKDGYLYSRRIKTEDILHSPSIQTVFRTSNKNRIADIMAEGGHSFKWHNDDSITLSVTLPAFRTHPLTGEELWFNQITTNADYWRNHPSWQEMTHLPVDQLPFHSYHADGSEISPDVIQRIRDVVWENSIGLSLKHGDVAILDNMLALHGRLGYVGKRKMFVNLALR